VLGNKLAVIGRAGRLGGLGFSELSPIFVSGIWDVTPRRYQSDFYYAKCNGFVFMVHWVNSSHIKRQDGEYEEASYSLGLDFAGRCN